MLVGLQLHPILNELLPDPATVRFGHAALVSAVVIATRLGWGFTVPYLALPLTTSTGEPFPHRHLMIFLTFGVILATLVGQGLSLPWLIRRLGLHRDDSDTREDLRGRLLATDAALARLEELAGEDWTRDHTIERMRGLYQFRGRRLKTRGGYLDDDGSEDRSLAYHRSSPTCLPRGGGRLPWSFPRHCGLSLW